MKALASTMMLVLLASACGGRLGPGFRTMLFHSDARLPENQLKQVCQHHRSVQKNKLL
ncbi:MAG TPA: hypothetical protein QGI62_08695 [Anaerolineales bacterium]|jgi:hypothetical protein|nr:hypothetical protein [Anaerolineales bacterium]